MKKKTANLTVCLLLAIGIFMADTSTPLGIAVGALYILVVALSAVADSAVNIVALSLFCSGLLVSGLFLSPISAVPQSLVIANRCIFFILILLTGALGIYGQRMRQTLQARDAELVVVNAKLELLALNDGLTGLNNRRGFDERLDAEWNRAMRDGAALSLIIIDVDLFKKYNDSFGHQAGDTCLVKIAQAIQLGFRRPGDFPARYGGEEFVVLLPETDLQGAWARAEAIRRKVESLEIAHPANPNGAFVTISLGVASAIPRANGHRGVAKLIEAADKALYDAKEAGRNRVAQASTDRGECGEQPSP